RFNGRITGLVRYPRRGSTVGDNIAVTVTGQTLIGSDANNYDFTPQADLKTNITTKTLTMSGVDAEDKVYDGNTHATLNTSSATPVGVVAGDDVTHLIHFDVMLSELPRRDYLRRVFRTGRGGAVHD